MRNAANRKSIRLAEKFAAETERSRIEFICAAMSTKQGRAWFHSLLATCSIFDGSFSGDALLEAFTKGQRNIGLTIYSDIVTNCPDSFIQMMREASIQEQLNDRREPDPADDEFTGGEDDDGGDN